MSFHRQRPVHERDSWIHTSSVIFCSELVLISYNQLKKPHLSWRMGLSPFNVCYPTLRLWKLFLKNPTSRKQLYSNFLNLKYPKSRPQTDTWCFNAQTAEEEDSADAVPCLPQGKSFPESIFTQTDQQPLSDPVLSAFGFRFNQNTTMLMLVLPRAETPIKRDFKIATSMNPQWAFIFHIANKTSYQAFPI